MVVAGLAGTPDLISCTILALASILHNFSGAMGQEYIKLILENVCNLMASSSIKIVASCLSFIKVYCTTLPSPMVAASLEPIIKAITNINSDYQRKKSFGLKICDILDRLMKKYGCDSLTPYTPTNTEVHKCFRNLRRQNARKKKKKKAEKDDGDSEENFIIKSKPRSMEEILADSDSDFEDMETDQPKIRNKAECSTWIEEDPKTIIDFTDPSVTSKITVTKPGQVPNSLMEKKKKDKGKDRGFKTSSDGRLIIKDDESSDSDSGNKRTKLGLHSDDSDVEDESQSIAETLLLTDRKRKRSSSSVKSGCSSASQPPTKYKAGGIGIHRMVGTSTSSVHNGYSGAGSQYRSKKAKGDVKKKGKLDPYAYLPLQRTALNKRKKKKAAGQFKNIVKATKLGSLKGAKAKRKKNK